MDSRVPYMTLTLPILLVTLLSLRAILENLFGNLLQSLYIPFQ